MRSWWEEMAMGELGGTHSDGEGGTGAGRGPTGRGGSLGALTAAPPPQVSPRHG